jgi:hypothetical protein
MTTPNTVYLTYNSYITQIAALAPYQTVTTSGVVQLSDGNGTILNEVVSQMIDYAELRIQRDLDLEQSVTNNSALALTIGNNLLTMDVNAFITVQSMSYVSGTVTQRILPTSRAFINDVYPDSSVQGPPIYFAPYGGDSTTTGGTSQLFLVGPTPDQAYPLSINGTVRMISLNSFATNGPASTSYTFISAYLPDLLLMASMIYLSGFQRNFGRQADDPTMAVSYEQQYNALLKGAMTEENRRKMWASAWTSLSVPVNATANR